MIRITRVLAARGAPPSGRRRRSIAGALTAVAAAALLTAAQVAPAVAAQSGAAAPTASVSYTETYRPQFHFTPAQNWMNDPNGLIYYRGEYHLFFQYNPSGNVWGNISWGHAVSRDLVHWHELPVAIPADEQNYAFSGSAVVDYSNTSGFGRPGNPAMVAIYTATDRVTNMQRQAIAYSLDKGRTFTKYGIVLDIGSKNFRDPKVFWYAPGHEWLMTAVLSDQHKVTFYTSPDLKHWTHLSDFGPAGATGGVWECPDLFPMPDPDHPGKQKWVLVVNLNPGGIAGGSGVQYFVGTFDGKTFTSDDKPYTPPTGTDLGSFDNGTFGGWTPSGTAFGSGPTAGNAPGQSGVTGYVGNGLANSFNSPAFDAGTGTLRSPDFTISRDYLNFLVGGGNHPYVPGSAVGDNSPPGTVFADFEGSTWGTGWTATGDFTSARPAAGAIGGQQQVTGYEGKQLVNTFTNGDASTGTITSPTFTIGSHYIDLLVGGGNHPSGSSGPTAVNLIVGGKVVATASGQNAEFLNWVSWDVSAYQGQQATIQIVDRNTAGWGHINVDQITFSSAAAAPRAVDTSVRLVVDGKVVRSATGSDSESLDWASWNVTDLKGRTAHIEIVDNSTAGWGHVLADQFSQSSSAATSAVQRAHWLDYGADDYAAVTFNDVPGGKRIMIGWMNNWLYAGSIPTSPWRSAMTVPRQLTLRDVHGALRIVQKPVDQLRRLRAGPVVHLQNLPIRRGSTPLPARGKALWIDATLRPGTATSYGLEVRTGAGGERTVIGYDRRAQQLYVDRTRSGDVSFDPRFSSIQRAPLPAKDGVVHLTVLVDWSSLEVFAQDGRLLITDQIFPSPRSTGVAAFAGGGTASLRSITVSHMRSAWTGRTS